MSRYIDADALLNNLPDDLPYKASVKRVLIQAPTADVAEVRHGRWILTDERFAEMSCSVCGFSYYGEWDEECMTNFCPDCGADMKGERGLSKSVKKQI